MKVISLCDIEVWSTTAAATHRWGEPVLPSCRWDISYVTLKNASSIERKDGGSKMAYRSA
jgi:hypothetical protein